MAEQKTPDAPKLKTRRIKLYTKKGDRGQTSLNDGNRCNKTEWIFTALGDLDELNCHIGVLIAHWSIHYSAPAPIHHPVFRKIQSNLINISSVVATPGPKSDGLTRISEKDISEIEEKIDLCQKLAPPLKQFILPGPKLWSVDHQSVPSHEHYMASIGSRVSAQAHVCKAIARRAERSVLGLWDYTMVEGNPDGVRPRKEHIGFIDPVPRSDKERNTLIYLNRLSDFFFAYSRAVVKYFDYLDLMEISMADMREK